MEPEGKVSILNYLPLSEVTAVIEQHETSTQTNALETPLRFIYYNTTETLKNDSVTLEVVADEEKKGRPRNPEKWRQNLRKKNKNRGLEYVRANGEIGPKKEMGPPCACKMKCYLRIGEEACKKIFNNFWKLGDHSLQNAYIAGCVRIFLPKHYSKRKNESQTPSRRFYTRYFYVNVNGVDTEICKQAFLNLHSISNGRLDRLLKKKQEAGNTGIDSRGRHNNKVNKVPLEKIREVRLCIDGFRKRAGFTGKRRGKSVEILPGPLNIRTMYRMYREDIIAKGQEPVCEFRFRKIFHNDFHIDFAKPPVNQPSSATAATVKPIQPNTQPQPEEPRQNSKTEIPLIASSFTLEEKPVYTTLEAKDNSNTSTYVTISQDMYNSYNMQTHNWIFPTQG